MTYKTGLSAPFFRAHNNTRQSGASVGTRFGLSNFYGCVGTSNSVLFTKAYLYGETRTAGGSSEVGNYDIGWDGGTVLTALSEGWQIRNNAVGTICGDDAIYAVSESEAAVIIKDSYNGQTGTGDIEETRIFGMRVQ